MMDVRLPLEAFSVLPLLLADTEGRVVFCNAAAERLFECDQCEERPCWEVARLRDQNGIPVCSDRCPMLRFAPRDVEPRRIVHLSRGEGESLCVELLTFVLPRFLPSGGAILHLIIPDAIPGDAEATPGGSGEPAAPLRGELRRLTPREREVLRLLARGLSTPAIARELYISTATVRNHVQHILDKLHVHGRLEAILAYLRRAAR